MIGKKAAYIKDGSFVGCVVLKVKKRFLRKPLYLIAYTVVRAATGPKKVTHVIYGLQVEEDVPAKPEITYKETKWVKEDEVIIE